MYQIDRAVIEINGGCNYTCKMCPQTTSDGKTGARGKNWLRKMSLSEFEDYVSQCAEAGLNVVNLEGSGEPTLNRNLPKYIEIVKKYNSKAFIFSNGFRVQNNFMKEIVDAGIDFFRFSIIGYDKETYKKWMNSDNFDIVVDNLHKMKEYIDSTKSSSRIATYHLILDNDNMDYEVEQYRKIVDSANVETEIWKMHNWSGVYKSDYIRKGKTKTCGRPFSPDIVIRAGGLDGEVGAVHPCCQVLGNDDAAVLGHISKDNVQDILGGKLYEDLREGHRTGDYPSYCENCDFLIEDYEVLIYTNSGRTHYKMNGTNFDIEDYRS